MSKICTIKIEQSHNGELHLTHKNDGIDPLFVVKALGKLTDHFADKALARSGSSFWSEDEGVEGLLRKLREQTRRPPSDSAMSFGLLLAALSDSETNRQQSEPSMVDFLEMLFKRARDTKGAAQDGSKSQQPASAPGGESPQQEPAGEVKETPLP